MGLLFFGVHLVYKLRNLTSDVHKEKLILCVAVFVELFVSAFAYGLRHILWHSLDSDHLLVLYAIRCQLSVTSTIALVFGPKVSGSIERLVAATAHPTRTFIRQQTLRS